jgi:hypothetical protein
LKNTIKPNIYECKICHEHHCEHDFPEEQEHMLQEMETVYSQSPAQAALLLRPPPQQRRPTAQQIAETIQDSQNQAEQPSTNAENVDDITEEDKTTNNEPRS